MDFLFSMKDFTNCLLLPITQEANYDDRRLFIKHDIFIKQLSN